MFIVGEFRDFKFGLQVHHSKSQPMDDKLPERGMWNMFYVHEKCKISDDKFSKVMQQHT